jgi:hypothetical protein
MAYTTSSNLLTAMQTNNASIEPYVKVGIVTSESGGTTIVTYDSDDRVIYLRIHEETWEGEGEVWLDNQDNGLVSYNYAGRRIHLHFGYEVAGGGDETVQRPDMWVLSQRFHTEKGRRYLILYLIDVWVIMSLQRSGGDSEGAAPAYNDGAAHDASNYTETIKEICTAILVTVKPSGYASGIGLTTQAGNLDIDGLGSPNLYTSGIFNEYEPYILTEWNSVIRQILRDLLRMTEVRLRTGQGGSGAGTNMEAHWLDTTDAADWTIESAGTSNVLWISRTMEDPLVLPNKVVFVDIIPDVGGSNTVVKADATNAFSVARIGTVGTQLLGPQQGTETTMGDNGTLTADNEVALRANMIMFDIELETDQGALRMRPHVGFQLLDMVQVNDALYGTGGFKARIGIIEMAFDHRPGLNDFPWNGYYADIQFGV